MNKIEVKVLNPEVVQESVKMMVTAARLTQSGHKVHSMNDFLELYNKSFTQTTIQIMSHLPHPTIQKFGVINVAVVGASRRFLAQITRHQNEVKFMSASLQYSDYTDQADFAVPYNILASGQDAVDSYLESCRVAMDTYKQCVSNGIDHDSCGYMAPQGLRNILIISATPYQWKHMISQRICRRNTDETRIVMLKIWDALYQLNPTFFFGDTTGPFCMQGNCKEGKFSCGKKMVNMPPAAILYSDYPLLINNRGDTNDNE